MSKRMDTIAELRYHAGLDEQAKSSAPSLADVLWWKESAKQSLDDVLRILQELNLELNGRIPSESPSRDQSLSRVMVYAVTEIISLLRKAANKASENAVKDELNRAAWRIEVGWSAILAGDIDDLEKHIDEEESASEV